MEQETTTGALRSGFERINSAIRKDPGAPLLVAGLSFVTGYLIGSGRTEPLRRTGGNLISDIGSLLFQSASESLQKRRQTAKQPGAA